MEAQKSLKEDVGLWLLAGVALLVVVSYYGWQYQFSESTEGEPWVFDGVEKQRIERLSLKKNQETKWTVGLNNSVWELLTPAEVEIDPSGADRLVNSLINLTPSHRFRAREGETYGTDNNSSRLVVQFSNQNHLIHFGGSRPSGSGRYLVYETGDNRTVFVVEQQDFDALNQSLYDLRRKSLFNTSVSSVRELTFLVGDESVTYRRNDGQWSVNGTTLNDTASDSFRDDLRTFLFLSADQFYDTQPEVLDQPRATVTVGLGNESISLEIGSPREGKRLVKKQGWPPVAVRQDPVAIFGNLPELPAPWPEPVEPSAGGNSNVPVAGGEGMPNLGNRGR